MEVVSEEGLSAIEYNADTILEEIGMNFSDYPSALDLLKNAGAEIDGERVRFPRGMCREIVTSSAPATYTHHARNPSRSVEIGGSSMVFVPLMGLHLFEILTMVEDMQRLKTSITSSNWLI